tara:strand:+ start:1301 stop:2254 length:954 start_codon:yes stop_codon:yes gene_type:complete
VKNVLIYRTDRIGDFLISTPIFSSLKRKFINCKIDIVCSNLNYDYVKSFNFFNKVLLYPDNIFKKISFYLSLSDYDHILVLDGKKRSIYNSIFKRSKTKTLFTPSSSIKKMFKYFFNNVYLIDYNIPKINLIKNFLLNIECEYESTDLNFLLKYENSKCLKYNKSFAEYIILNLDEKWIYKNYIKTYKNIEPTLTQFVNFLSILSKNNKVIIVNGFFENPLLEKLKNSNYINDNTNLVIKDKINIFELQFLIKHCNCLISCHGAPSHIASNYNVKVIDIVDDSEIKFFSSYNHHFKNKVQIIREDFNNLSRKIIENL